MSISCTTASVRPVIGDPGAGNVCMCLAKRLAARARWLLVISLAASSTSIKCGGSAHSPALRSVSRVPMCCMAFISYTRAMPARAGIITGCIYSLLISLCMGRSYIVVLELSSRLRLRALAICQLIFQIPVRMSVARVRLPRWALIDHCWFSVLPTASLPSVVVYTLCLLFQRNIP